MRHESLYSSVGWRKDLERMTVRHLWEVCGSLAQKDLFEKLTRKMLVAPFLFPRLPKHLVLHEFLQWGLWIYMVGLEVGEFLKPLNCLGNVSICVFSGFWWKESGTCIRFLRGSLKGLNCQCDKTGDYHAELMSWLSAAPVLYQHCCLLKLNISVFLCCHH